MNSTISDIRSWVDIRTGIIVFWWLSLTVYLFTRGFDNRQFAVYFVGMTLFLYIYGEVAKLNLSKRSEQVIGAGYLLILLGVLISSVYLWVNYAELRFTRVGVATQPEIYLSVYMVSVILLFTYKEYGLPLSVVAATVIFYAYFGWLFPGVLRHPGLSTERIAGTVILNFQGIYGFLTAIVVDWIVIFLLYAGLVRGYGGFDHVLRISTSLRGIMNSGVAQVSLIASMIIGSINGSGVANTGITGSITIPVMKDSGIKSDLAAGIEAVASTGGQILPPVMGTSAFLMAAILPYTYADILAAAVVPGIMFYAATAYSIHAIIPPQTTESDRLGPGEGDTGIGDDDRYKDKRYILIQSVIFLIPFLALVYLLGYLRYSISYSALTTTGLMIVMGTVVPVATGLKSVRKVLAETVEGAKIGAEGAIPIVIVVATIGVIVDILTLTGTPGKIAIVMLDISGGVLLIALLISFILCIILGMGMPTPAAYLIVAVVVAPALVRDFGMSDIAVHFFVLYAAMLSMLTPPIAVCVVVASGIANSNFWQTSVKALRVGFPMFILPFIFIHHPVIVSLGFTAERLLTGATILAGIVMIGFGLNQRVSKQASNYILKIGVIVLGVGVIYYASQYILLLPLIVAGILVAYLIPPSYKNKYVYGTESPDTKTSE